MVDRLLLHGETLEQLRAAFMVRVQVTTSGCWLWDGDAEHYGNFRGELAHRVSWELHQGPIPEGLYILHGCDIGGAERAAYGCVNPMHIRPGTPKENTQDLARAKARARSRRTKSAHHHLGQGRLADPISKIPEPELQQMVAEMVYRCAEEARGSGLKGEPLIAMCEVIMLQKWGPLTVGITRRLVAKFGGTDQKILHELALSAAERVHGPAPTRADQEPG